MAINIFITRKQYWLPLVAVGFMCLAYMPVSHAENMAKPPSHHALVLENDAYAIGALANPAHDAELIIKTLTKLGFEVETAHNLTKDKLLKTVRQFSDKLPVGAIAVVYYAGHGMQLQGDNYLIPIDMQPTSEQSAALKAYPLKMLLDQLSSAPSAVNIVILDACRNNPFRPTASRYRDLSKMGLAKISTPKGTIIAYSTAPGQYAADGVGNNNSLYTQILSEELLRPEQAIEVTFKNVADRVRKKTLDDQAPWYSTSLVDSFYFIPPADVSILTLAPNKNQQQAVNARAIQKQSSSWYLSLHGEEWAELEHQIEQRAAHLTKDEIPQLSHRADNGNVVAMTTLALAYQEGLQEGRHSQENRYNQESHYSYDAVTRAGASNKKSRQWLSKAAKAGFPIAQRLLGEMYLLATTIDFDSNTGLSWLEQAAQSDYPLAKLDLAQRQYETDPTSENSEKLWSSIQDQGMALQGEMLKKLQLFYIKPHS